jgi:hypothetical protein
MIRTILAFLVIALLVTSCGNRAQFDKQLAEGCKAAARHVLSNRDPSFDLRGVGSQDYTNSGIVDNGRKVTMTAKIQQSDGSGFPEERKIVCHYQESISFAGLVYSPTFYQIKLGDERYGRDKDGNLINDIQSFTALNDAVTQSLN